MEIEIVSAKENPLLKRKEIHFQVKHGKTGSTPSRLEVRSAIASALKAKMDLTFVRKLVTKTGTQIAVGFANIYETIEQARLVEPDHIIKRNAPPKEPAEDKKE